MVKLEIFQEFKYKGNSGGNRTKAVSLSKNHHKRPFKMAKVIFGKFGLCQEAICWIWKLELNSSLQYWKFEFSSSFWVQRIGLRSIFCRLSIFCPIILHIHQARHLTHYGHCPKHPDCPILARDHIPKAVDRRVLEILSQRGFQACHFGMSPSSSLALNYIGCNKCVYVACIAVETQIGRP